MHGVKITTVEVFVDIGDYLCHYLVRLKFNILSIFLEESMTPGSQKRDKSIGIICKGLYPDGERKYICISEEGILVLSRVSEHVFVLDVLKNGITPNILTEVDTRIIFDGEESVNVEPLRAGEVSLLEQEFDVASRYFFKE